MLSGTSVSYVPRQVPDKIRAVLLISMSNIIIGMLDLEPYGISKMLLVNSLFAVICGELLTFKGVTDCRVTRQRIENNFSLLY